MNSLAGRIAAAPISWGVCEVPGWGPQLPATRVLAEMAALGITAIEFGPDGFLPDDPAAKAAVLAEFRIQPVGGFVPVVLHEPAYDPAPSLEAVIDGFLAAGASMLVLAAATGRAGYEGRPDCDSAGWQVLLRNLDTLDRVAAQRGITAVLHPHVGTMVEGPRDVARVLTGSGIGLCLDTGHLVIGGSDPLRLARESADRIKHVHLKDVDAAIAEKVRDGFGYTDAVRGGLYRRLGDGAVDIAGIVAALEVAGYRGWYVMEQDTILPAEGTDADPAEDVRAGLEFLRDLP